MPDRRHLALLGVGVLIGLLLGPMVLGQISPAAYRAIFTGDRGQVEQLEAAIDDLERQRSEVGRLAQQSDVTEVAVDELRQEIDREQAVIEKAFAYEQLRYGLLESASLLLALVVALVVVSIFDATIGPRPGRSGRAVLTPMHGRVTTIRYALLASILAVLVARPLLLNEVSWVFVTLLLGVIAIAGFVPLGRRD